MGQTAFFLRDCHIDGAWVCRHAGTSVVLSAVLALRNTAGKEVCMEVTMTQDKVTKNAVRYSEPKKADDPHTKTIYLTKAELQAEFGKIPEAIKVTVEEA